MTKGTPKSLKEAVRRALQMTTFGVELENSVSEEKVEIVEQIIKDYLAQKFDPRSMSQPAVQHVWQKIKGAA